MNRKAERLRSERLSRSKRGFYLRQDEKPLERLFRAIANFYYEVVWFSLDVHQDTLAIMFTTKTEAMITLYISPVGTSECKGSEAFVTACLRELDAYLAHYPDRPEDNEASDMSIRFQYYRSFRK